MSIDTLRTNKMRSALTVLGVVIGITSIVGMTSLIRGFDDRCAIRSARSARTPSSSRNSAPSVPRRARRSRTCSSGRTSPAKTPGRSAGLPVDCSGRYVARRRRQTPARASITEPEDEPDRDPRRDRELRRRQLHQARARAVVHADRGRAPPPARRARTESLQVALPERRPARQEGQDRRERVHRRRRLRQASEPGRIRRRRRLRRHPVHRAGEVLRQGPEEGITGGNIGPAASAAR